MRARPAAAALRIRQMNQIEGTQPSAKLLSIELSWDSDAKEVDTKLQLNFSEHGAPDQDAADLDGTGITRTVLQILGLQVESGSSPLPQDVMQMHHAASRTPLKDSHVGTRAIERHHYSLKDQLKADSAIPRHEKWRLVYR